MADIKIYNVEALGKPLGQYSHITRVKANEHLFIAGMLAAGETFDAQCSGVFAPDRGRAQVRGRRLGERGPVHHLPRALAGHPEVHAVAPARIPADVSGRRAIRRTRCSSSTASSASST